MGARTSKLERQRREQIKKLVIDNAIQDIKSDNTSVAKQNSINVRQCKIEQLSRNGKELIKLDLIAILATMNNISLDDPKIKEFAQMSCSDLRSAIRLQLYSNQLNKNKFIEY